MGGKKIVVLGDPTAVGRRTQSNDKRARPYGPSGLPFFTRRRGFGPGDA